MVKLDCVEDITRISFCAKTIVNKKKEITINNLLFTYNPNQIWMLIFFVKWLLNNSKKRSI